MKQTRRKFDAAFKANVTLEALKRKETLEQLALKFELHPNQISLWKRKLIKNSVSLFETKHSKSDLTTDVLELHEKIDMLEEEKKILKGKIKTLRTHMDIRLLLEKDGELSLRKQCELLDINRSSVYYKSKRKNSGNV